MQAMAMQALTKQRELPDGLRRLASGPEISLGAILTFSGSTEDGRLIESVAIPWFAIMERINRDREEIFRIPAHTWEELIAGAYHKAGFDEVILTPRSGDLGRDVIATKKGVGSICIYDQVKAYRRGHLVSANDVRALAGILQGNVSKGVMTTTSDFAPRVGRDPIISALMPHRLELKPGDVLVPWLLDLSMQRSSTLPACGFRPAVGALRFGHIVTLNPELGIGYLVDDETGTHYAISPRFLANFDELRVGTAVAFYENRNNMVTELNIRG